MIDPDVRHRGRYVSTGRRRKWSCSVISATDDQATNTEHCRQTLDEVLIGGEPDSFIAHGCQPVYGKPNRPPVRQT